MSARSSETEEDIPLLFIKKTCRKQRAKILQEKHKKILYKKEFCCVCLNNASRMHKVTKKFLNEDVNLLTMLERIVPRIEWCSFYHMCTPCSTTLVKAHTFWETCLNNSFLARTPLVSSLRNENFFKNVETKKENHKLLSTMNEQNVNNVELKIENNTFDNTKDKNDKINANDVLNDSIKSEHVKAEQTDFDKYGGEEDNRNIHDNTDDNVKITSDVADEENGDDLIQNNDIIEKGKINKRKRKSEQSLEFSDAEESLNKKSCKKKQNFTCQYCQFTTKQSSRIQGHYLEQHNQEYVFRCDRCSKIFDKYWSLMQHMTTHNEDRPFICSHCGKGFKRDADLQSHEIRHLNTREFKCELCSKSYKTSKDLGSHKIAVHSDRTKWKWVCEVCCKPFPIKSNYDSHMRRHKGDKKFACYLCPKKFTDKIVLQKHFRVHSNVRNFKCSECQKEYKDRNTMMIHMARVHSIGVDQVKIPKKPSNKFICHICPKAFPDNNKLTRHLYSHTGEKPFGCHLCDKKFVDKSYVTQHVKRAHGIKDEKQM